MPRLLVAYDPSGRLEMPGSFERQGLRHAVLDLPAGLENIDIYAQAKKLTELLLENLEGS